MASFSPDKLTAAFYFILLSCLYSVDGRSRRPILNKVVRLERTVKTLMSKLDNLEAENRHLSHRISHGHGVLNAKREIGFYAILSSNQHVRTDDTVIFNHVITSIGNAYDSKTGTFTCPKDGTYLFNLNVLSSEGDYIEADVIWRTESKLKTISYNKGEDSYSQGSGSAILKLSKGDVIRVSIAYAQGEAKILKGFSNFSGYLIFQSE